MLRWHHFAQWPHKEVYPSSKFPKLLELASQGNENFNIQSPLKLSHVTDLCFCVPSWAFGLRLHFEEAFVDMLIFFVYLGGVGGLFVLFICAFVFLIWFLYPLKKKGSLSDIQNERSRVHYSIIFLNKNHPAFPTLCNLTL